MRKIKLKNKSKAGKKKYKKAIKVVLFIFFIYLSYKVTYDYLIIKKADIKKDEILNFLLENSYREENKTLLFKEGLKLISNIDLNDSKTLLSKNIKYYKNDKVYEKDNLVKEDDYNESALEKITSYVENPNKETSSPIIYLYNTHQLEAYSNYVFENTSISPNVLMASYLLSEKLNKNNISTISEDTNINEFNRVSGITSSDFYDTTRIFLKEKMSKYNTIKYYVDIHRDSVSKDISTCEIDGKNYARILFVVGTKNENYEKNKSIMKDLDEISDKYYNGLSRGIYERKAYYNQDLNNNIILIELGGKDNTLEEVTNTVDALSLIFTKYINGENK